jgi:hypothetical protein
VPPALTTDKLTGMLVDWLHYIEIISETKFPPGQEQRQHYVGGFDAQGLVHYEFIPGVRTVNKDMYMEILCRDTVRRERAEKMGSQQKVSSAPQHSDALCRCGFWYVFFCMRTVPQLLQYWKESCM